MRLFFFRYSAGEQWVKLPHVTPAEINGARSITKLLTGRLDAKVNKHTQRLWRKKNKVKENTEIFNKHLYSHCSLDVCSHSRFRYGKDRQISTKSYQIYVKKLSDAQPVSITGFAYF